MSNLDIYYVIWLIIFRDGPIMEEQMRTNEANSFQFRGKEYGKQAIFDTVNDP